MIIVLVCIAMCYATPPAVICKYMCAVLPKVNIPLGTYQNSKAAS